MTTTEQLTLIIAIYGAVVATLSAARQFWVDRASLKVSLSTIIPMEFGRLGQTHAQVTVVNNGQRQAVVDWLGFELSDGRTLALLRLSGSEVPAKLSQGEKATVSASYAEIAEGLRASGLPVPMKIRGLCKDSAGRQFRSKPWVIDPDEWARM